MFLASSFAFFAFILEMMSAAGFSSGEVFLMASRVFGVVYFFQYQFYFHLIFFQKCGIVVVDGS